MPAEWTVNPLDFIPHYKGKFKKLCEEVAIEIYAGVIQRTPVSTGNLRASWRIKVNGIDDSIEESGSLENIAPAPKIPTSLEPLPDNPVINITNSQRYAAAVENGGPRNEPRKMVALTLESLKP